MARRGRTASCYEKKDEYDMKDGTGRKYTVARCYGQEGKSLRQEGRRPDPDGSRPCNYANSPELIS